MWPSFTNVPNEYLERYYPLRIERYVTVTDSGGPGENRGGNGVEVAYRFLRPGDVSIHDDRWFTYPWGVNGGQPGARSTKILERVDGTTQVLPSKCDNVRVAEGDLLRYITWGGGGWGDPLQRPPERVAVDVQRGLVSADGARRYGVVVTDDGEVDAAKTAALRQQLRRSRPPIRTFDTGPGMEELRARCLQETGLPAPMPPAQASDDLRPPLALWDHASMPGGAAGADLSGRVAVITGGDDGMAQAAAAALRAAGAHVLVGTADAVGVQARLTAAGADAAVVQTDLSDPAAVDALCDQALAQWGRLDIAVAAGTLGRRTSLADLDDDGWAAQVDADLTSVMRTCRAASTRMVDGGSIVCVSSVAGAVLGWSDHVAHAAAKASVVGLARSLAAELGPRDIRVNVVLPGLVTVPSSMPSGDERPAAASAARRVPLGRVGDAHEIAAAIRFLASDEATYVSGEALVVDGGFSAQMSV
jgi:NAD(P)-dependent dehydrogenase (short-subunit alcohol dehydrogenase family)